MDNVIVQSRYLAQNPMIIEITGSIGDFVTVFVNDLYHNAIFSARLDLLSGTLYYDISFAFANMTENADVKNYELVIMFDRLGTEFTRVITVYFSGISKGLIRKLKALNTNIFDFKLKNLSKNFLLTSRSNSNLIIIPENELMPLYYYSYGMSFSVKSMDETVANVSNPTTGIEQLKSIDISNLRYSFYRSKRIIASLFKVSETYILITQARPTDFFIEFRNSWGVMERKAIYGVVEYSPAFTETDDISKYNTSVHLYERLTRRKELTHKYRAETGYTDASERLFLMDMLLSGKCDFIAHGKSYPAKVTADSQTLQTTSGEPVTMSLSIELLDKDNFYSPLDDELATELIANGLMDDAGDYITDNDFEIITIE